MKYIFMLSAIAFISLISLSHSQQKFDPSGESEFQFNAKFIRIYVEYYEVSTLEYADIMTKEHLWTDDTKLRNKLLQMAKDGKAKLVESQTITARSGEKATNESVTEYIYPTEYEPPYTETKTDKNGETSTVNFLNPTAFETRNVGATLEVEPTLADDGATIDLRIAPEIVELIGHSLWGHSAVSNTPIKMPTFYTYRTDTALTLRKGLFHMAAALTPKDDKHKANPSKKILMFVKAEILNSGR